MGTQGVALSYIKVGDPWSNRCTKSLGNLLLPRITTII